MISRILALSFFAASFLNAATQELKSWGNQTTVPAGLTDIKAIAAGGAHTIVLKTDGTLAVWGDNVLGACNVPSGLSGVVAIAAGGHHSLAVKNDGTVVAWGRNYDGECNVPAGLSGVIAVAAASFHSLAVKSDGTVVVWGSNYYGERNVPPGLTGVIAIATEGSHNVALKSDGTVVAWGTNGSGECNVPVGLSGVTAVAAGWGHSLALKNDGTVVAWGSNADGRCNIPAGLVDVKAISVGTGYNLALKRDGTVIAWGINNYGQCNVPSDLSGVTAIAAGEYHGVALTGQMGPQITITFDSRGGNVISSKSCSENTLYGVLPIPTRAGYNFDGWFKDEAYTLLASATLSAGTQNHVLYAKWTVAPPPVAHNLFVWGNNSAGQSTIPANLTNVTAVAPGGWHTLAIKTDGAVIGWGANADGQCNTPSGLGSGVKAIAGGGKHSLAIKSDGTVMAWGYNVNGQCNVPAGLSGVIAVDADSYHTIALKNNGTVAVWGSNFYGERNVPAGLSNVTHISAGHCFNLVRKSNGTVAAWGQNSSGQCTVPPGLSGVKSVVAGAAHSLALKEDGTIVAWGDNSQGQSTVPAGLSNVVSIAAGWVYSVALKSNGTIVMWGNNDDNRCIVPAGLANAVFIAAGENHTAALVDNSTPPVTLTVSFNSQGGSSVESKTCNENTVYGTLPVPTRTGYAFAGWFIDSACTTPISATDLVGTEDHTLYAKWSSHGILRFQKVAYSIAEDTDAGGILLRVERTGGSTGAASVSVVVENGSATNDLDYSASPVTLNWADGVTSVQFVGIGLFDDDDYEGNETFSVRLVNATGAIIGDPGMATVTIVDDEGALASVARFEGTLDFGSVSKNSTSTRIIKVWNDGNQPLVVTDVTVPDGFTVSPQSFTVKPGEYTSLSVNFTPTTVASFSGVLGLVCTANSGASSIAISGSGIEPPRPVALRTITGLTAVIAVDVPAGVNVLSVEDMLAPGMMPLSISDGGTWDPVNRKVKWFFDKQHDVRDRALQYAVASAGSVLLGQASFGEGNSYPVSGDTLFVGGDNPGLLHPADVTGDWSVDQSEVSASISRWKSGQENLKTAIAIRGITLYLQGEQYAYSAGVSAEAKRWIPIGDPLASSDAPVFTTFSIPQASAVRNVQSNSVTIVITPAPGTTAYGMEEFVAPGVVVSNISNEGTWDAINRKIKWAFYDGDSRILSYTVSGPEGLQVSLTGLASFDGSEDPVTGATSAAVPLTYQSWASAKGLSGNAAAFDAVSLARGEANGLLYAFGSNLSDGESVIDITWINGGPVIETPAQDPATAPFVLLIIEGTSTLTVPADWSINLELAADQSGVSANRRRWVPVATPPDCAFFRIRATQK